MLRLPTFEAQLARQILIAAGATACLAVACGVASAGGAAGSVTVKVVPSPTALSTVTRPAMASTRCLTMDSPSPVPPRSRERPVSTR